MPIQNTRLESLEDSHNPEVKEGSQYFSIDQLFARTNTYHHLGIDSKNRHHYADPLLGAVWVTIDDEIAHIESTKAIEQWVTYTSEYVGWSTCNYSTQSLAEWLATALQEGR